MPERTSVVIACAGTFATVVGLLIIGRRRLHQSARSQRILLVCDLNGVVCARLPGAKTVLRPGAQAFLRFIFDHFDVAVWTAQHRPRLLAELQMVCTDEQRRAFKFAWDGSHLSLVKGVCSPTNPTVPSRNKSGKPWFIKPLAQISAATNVAPDRILILDDGEEKLFGNPPGSGLVVPCFTGKDEHCDNFLALDGEFVRALQALAEATRTPCVSGHEYVCAHAFLSTLSNDDAGLLLSPSSLELLGGQRTTEEQSDDDGLPYPDHKYKVDSVRRNLRANLFHVALDGGLALALQLAFEVHMQDEENLSRLKTSVAALLENDPSGEEVVDLFGRALLEWREMGATQQLRVPLGAYLFDLFEGHLGK